MIAPTTVITALLFYFGLLHAQALTRYFGVSSTVFGFTTQDYLVRSADGLFVPLTLIASCALGVLLARRVLVRIPITLHREGERAVRATVAILGLVIIVLSLLIAVGSLDAGFPPESGGLLLCLGALTLTCVLRWHVPGSGRPLRGDSAHANTRTVEYAVAFVLVTVGLFWAINSYAIGVGTGRAQQIEDALGSSPDLVVLSRGRLGLQAPAVTETMCSDRGGPSESSFRFRYTGLKYVLQSGNYYLLLPATWRHGTSPAFVVPRSDAVQLQFYPSGQGVPLAC
ncbi:hypothetical protein [Actinomycetospora sp. TBRC 11914]|uniref:hypothetical protein n=1 Tax=Actinomycetospora sp. TBRC 11914 TaxID=2729387 RepID=UPI00145D9BB4|nr:hypothetical protein [Actinomycetospora sp. TBRC 11914]NMO90313.1 hypothetical protein [Actinomycetospora sp. TBRC 11914]